MSPFAAFFIFGILGVEYGSKTARKHVMSIRICFFRFFIVHLYRNNIQDNQRQPTSIIILVLYNNLKHTIHEEDITHHFAICDRHRC